MNTDSYPPIADYGFIADCHSAALVSKTGSIDWCCMPRLDSRSCFGRILDWNNGGYCQIEPTASYKTSRRYMDRTLILETTFQTKSGQARLIDCFTMRRRGEHDPHRQILRVIEGMRGNVEFKLDIVPRFDFGAIKPWIRCYRKHSHIAIGGCDGLLISSDVSIKMRHRHDLTVTFTVGAGERKRFSILHRPPENLDENLTETPDPAELDRRLQETIQWWQNWSDKGRYSGPYAEQMQRSAMVLKGLSNAPTGAIVAAPTTSLPEAPGGSRNWDYRFSWVRDSSFTVRSLVELNYVKEADGFRRFIERSAAGSADQLQILYGIGGERRLHEYEIGDLAGYRGAKPVRIGNAAESQIQLDAYGELLDLAWHWHCRQRSPDDDYWEFLMELVNKVCDLWQRADCGIWEFRGSPRHFGDFAAQQRLVADDDAVDIAVGPRQLDDVADFGLVALGVVADPGAERDLEAVLARQLRHVLQHAGRAVGPQPVGRALEQGHVPIDLLDGRHLVGQGIVPRTHRAERQALDRAGPVRRVLRLVESGPAGDVAGDDQDHDCQG